MSVQLEIGGPEHGNYHNMLHWIADFLSPDR